jgi:hypothetical protein
MRRNRPTEWLKAHPITYPKTIELDNPFDLLHMESLTDIQRMVQKYAKVFKYYCTFAFSASCGAGKTLAGIYLMHYFGVKTLIVSSRSAINDQWEAILRSIYPSLRIKTIHSKKVEEPDVYIYSPQYLVQDLSKFPADVNFVIYDEIHSIVSDKFGECVKEPQRQIKDKKRQTMPYMLALSGTYPKESTIISKIFGDHVRTESDITKIPINVYDYHCSALTKIIKETHAMFDENGIKKRSKKLLRLHELTKEITSPITNLSSLSNETLIALDEIYKPLDDYDFIDQVLPQLPKFKINPSTIFRGFIITNTIDSSVYAAVAIANQYKCNAILMRSVDEPSYIITPTGYEFTDNSRSELTQDYLSSNYERINLTKVNLTDLLNEKQVAVICGCYHRLKEGISIENSVWGICTKFIYSTIARTQILGRIRRTSKNDAITNHVRTFIVNSSAVNTNEHKLLSAARKAHTKMNRSLLAPLYDFAYEDEVFSRENYVYKEWITE